MVILSIVIFTILLIIGFLRKDGLFSPWMITTSVWLSILITYVLWGDLLNPLGNTFINSIILWVSLFYLTSFSVFYFYKGEVKKRIPSLKVLDFLFWVSILTSPLFLYEIYESVVQDGTGALLFDLRYQALNSDKDYGILNYLKNFNKALLILEFLRPRLNKSKIIIISIINILFGISIMEKGTFFFVIFVVIYFLYNKKAIKKRAIAISISGFIFLSFVLNQMRTHESSTQISFESFFAVYIMSPAAAFDTLEETPYNSEFGENTFSFFYALSNSVFGTNFQISQKVKEFVSVPLPTNVYTIMQPFYEDFGIAGIIVFSIIMGAICGYYYKRHKNGNSVSTGIYSFLAYLLILQFFQEEFFVSLSVFLQIVIVISLPFLFNAKKYY